MDPLKLIVLDKDDLQVASTHLQDAVVSVGDIVWLPEQKRLVVGLNRFDWEQSAAPECAQYHRRRTALRFERVNALKSRNIDRELPDNVLNLLAVDFDESDPPGGCVTLMFSGGGALRLDVECLEAELVDLGPEWPTDHRPGHADEAAEPRG
jgi:hypothetical protein